MSQDWRELARKICDANPNMPKGIQDLAGDLTGQLALLSSQMVGNLELAWRRGQHEGYLNGYKDAKGGKPNRWEQ